MNKYEAYQKALDDISLEVSEEFVNNTNPQALGLIQELIDYYKEKETPMNLKTKEYKNSMHYHCPVCNYRYAIIDYGEQYNEARKGSRFPNYCSVCGQKLDWSDKL